MRGVKAVVKCLRWWIEFIASRILILSRRRKKYGKIFIRYEVKTFLYDGHPAQREQSEIPILDILDRIADRRFEDACDLARRTYGIEITKRCAKKLRHHVPNPEADAEDITQQVFLEFLRALREGKYEPSKRTVKGFLLTIADRRAIGILRMRNRIVPGRDSDVDELDRRDLHESYASNPELMVLANEERKRVNRINREVERLPFADRQILHWRYTLGHSVVTIAQFMGEKRGTIAGRISRACAKLRVVCNSDD